MYYLNKIIGFLISPIGIAIVGLVIAVVCAWLKRVRLAKLFGCHPNRMRIIETFISRIEIRLKK
jgi:hypothetical protein